MANQGGTLISLSYCPKAKLHTLPIFSQRYSIAPIWTLYSMYAISCAHLDQMSSRSYTKHLAMMGSKYTDGWFGPSWSDLCGSWLVGWSDLTPILHKWCTHLGCMIALWGKYRRVILGHSYKDVPTHIHAIHGIRIWQAALAMAMWCPFKEIKWIFTT